MDKPDQAVVMDALAWLRQHVRSNARVVSDSRQIQPGDVFIAYAVRGADSRLHIQDAMTRGAAAMLYQPENWPTDVDIGALDHTTPCPAMLPLAQLDQLAGPIASRWYGEPSSALRMIGITGTNGKTSCSHWTAKALGALGEPCAVMGTLGIGFPGQLQSIGYTTPDAAQLQRSLAELRAQGARAVAMEVSSHALDQGRANGTAFDIAVFTNLSQDHLDYHHTLAAYEAAKSRLFQWPSLNHAVINVDDAAGRRILAQIRGRVPVTTYSTEPVSATANVQDKNQDGGPGAQHLCASAIRATASGTAFDVQGAWGNAKIEIAMLGIFNVSNVLAVLGTLLAAGVPWNAALQQLSALQPVAGRMQWVGGRVQANEPLIVIDYAHTPDALEKTLHALRPVAQQRGGQLICIFGCGGERDSAKRPLMGEIAERLADQLVLTSDNPRGEPPAAIIDHIVAGLRDPAQARRIEDRAVAILHTIRSAQSADVILLAGKGHETTQEIAGKKRPFSDHDHASLALAARATYSRGDAK